MDSISLTALLTILAPVLSAALTGGGIAAYFTYRANRPESDAKAKQILIASDISVADAWQNYAVKVEARFNELEKKYDAAMAIKDKEIERLTAEVLRLRKIVAKYDKGALDVPAENISPSHTG